MTTTSKLLTSAEAASRIGIRANTLEIWRLKGQGPRFIKLVPTSARSPIRYRESDIESWLDERVFTSTSQCSLV